jgi:aromatic-L-amino-acid decarboxylase
MSAAKDAQVPPKSNSGFHMSPEDFRQAAEQLTEWIIEYRTGIERYPVKSQVMPGDVSKSLPAHAPASGESFDQVLRDVQKLILPGVTNWQSPNFFAYFPANASEPSMLGDLLSSAMGVQGMLWETGPACTELEIVVLDWLAEMLGLPPQFHSRNSGGGVIQDSASSATLCAILSARERATDYSSNENGCRQSLTAYTSAHAHSSIEKDIKIAGIGRKNLRLIEVSDDFTMRTELLEKAIEQDKKDGHIPFFVCAAVGTTSTLAIDPVEEIGRICRKHNVWLHIDAAMAGSAAICPEFRHIHKGIEFADSYVFDAHKWLFTNFDCSCYYVADRSQLINTLSITPEYLRNTASESGAVTDFRDWHVPLGRRFRALKLWLVIRHYGVEGLQFHIRQHVELTQWLVEQVKADARFEIAAPPSLNLVCFRLKGSDEQNQQLMTALNKSGKMYLSHTRLNGRFVIRLCVGQTRTERRHVEQAWEMIKAEAEKLG